MKKVKLIVCCLILFGSISLSAGEKAIISFSNISIRVVKDNGTTEVTEISSKTSLEKNSQEVSSKLLIVINKLEAEGYKMVVPLGQHFGGSINMILFERP